MFSCILRMVVKLSITFFPNGVIIFCMRISCIQASGFFPEHWVVPYHRFIRPPYFATVCRKLNVTTLEWALVTYFLYYVLSKSFSYFQSLNGKRHTHTQSHKLKHRQHGNITGISIVLFLLREESWLMVKHCSTSCYISRVWGCYSKGRTKNGDIWEETVQENVLANKRGSNVKLENSIQPGVIFSLHQILFEWRN
jgi:hypothetical protein